MKSMILTSLAVCAACFGLGYYTSPSFAAASSGAFRAIFPISSEEVPEQIDSKVQEEKDTQNSESRALYSVDGQTNMKSIEGVEVQTYSRTKMKTYKVPWSYGSSSASKTNEKKFKKKKVRGTGAWASNTSKSRKYHSRPLRKTGMGRGCSK